ncbi:MAG: glutamate-1-semialdehyde 2,1-aminomutase [Planctomycetota bacterium]|nr:glutamate-1-semialdehyde 2,1-aminomutase [Planctomycetota bacterium]
MPTPLSGPKSRAAFTAARKRIPGGVNSPVRAWSRLGGKPPVIARGEGAWIEDVDKRRYVDYVLSWGPLIHGHAHPAVVKAVQDAAAKGLSFGAPTASETALADMLVAAIPGMQQVRLVNSGTEATMSALRLARAATGRDLIIKCDGCYHGHADHLLVAAGSGAATFGEPDSAGVPAAFAEKTLVVPYNDAAAVTRMLKKHKGQVAAVIVEPVAGNMGLVLPQPGYLKALRAACTAHGTLLVFDEVMTGFRTCYGGYQRIAKVRPDLTCLGKVIGGGMPAAAYGGPRAIMRLLAPEGPCYQAGTLSGNPVAVAAGLASLKLAARSGFYDRLGKRLTGLISAMAKQAAQHGVPWQAAQVGTMWGWFFSDVAVTDFSSAAAAHMERWAAFTRELYLQGVNVAPSPFEAAFFSSAHGKAELVHTLAATDRAFAAAARV